MQNTVALLLLLLPWFLIATTAGAQPNRNKSDPSDVWRVPNVPYHRQVTDYSCGAASAEMVLHYFGGIDVDQRAVMDVARTESIDGTLSLDVVRAGHFSHASAAVGDQFPSSAPAAGYAGRPLGLAAWGYRPPTTTTTGENVDNVTCWLPELKALMRSTRQPVILLMFYDTVEWEGHFRVAVGVDDAGVTFHDPWDRTGPQVAWYNDSYTCLLWSHAEPYMNGTRFAPYFAAMYAPWTVDLVYFPTAEPNTTLVSATVTFPCPAPLCDGLGPADVAVDSSATITLPPGWQLAAGSAPVSQPLGTNRKLQAGQTVNVYWAVMTADQWDKSAAASALTVTAAGLITASVPATPHTQTTLYPAYTYSDWIGGTASVAL